MRAAPPLLSREWMKEPVWGSSYVKRSRKYDRSDDTLLPLRNSWRCDPAGQSGYPSETQSPEV